MSNFDTFKNAVIKYLSIYDIDINFLSTLREVSLNDAEEKTKYLYTGDKNIEVVSMDILAEKVYKQIRGTFSADNPIASVDAFLINNKNNWYFIEFKDCPINGKKSSVKNNIIKKAYENWYMVLDIIYSLAERGEKTTIFDIANPVNFARNHVYYILVCSAEKNVNIYNQVKNNILLHQNYTPPFMQRLKDYLFKDAFVCTEDYFEQRFVNKFTF